MTRSHNYKILSVAIALLCPWIMTALPTYAQSVQHPTKIASSGETVITAHSPDINIEAKIMTHGVQIGKPSDGRPAVVRSNCTYSKYPCSIVDLVDISVNEKAVVIPRSVFCDLADLNEGNLEVGQKEAVLTLTGGDASESYFAKIRFNMERVTGRSVFDGEFGKKLEETTYYKVEVDDGNKGSEQACSPKPIGKASSDGVLGPSWAYPPQGWELSAEQFRKLIDDADIHFEDYPTTNVFSGKRRRVILDTRFKRTFRTVLTKASKEAPNFDGKYVVASWGCGTNCQWLAIINLENGVVTDGMVSEWIQGYRVDSSLLIVNSPDAVLKLYKDRRIPSWVYTAYYRWDGNNLVLLKSINR